jgi:hypothetical protein
MKRNHEVSKPVGSKHGILREVAEYKLRDTQRNRGITHKLNIFDLNDKIQNIKKMDTSNS